MLTRYERHPTLLLIRRCRRGSTTSGESRFVKRTFGSIGVSTGVSTGLQSHIPKVRSTRSAYPACNILPVLAALSLITSQPRYSFTSPSSCPQCYCRLDISPPPLHHAAGSRCYQSSVTLRPLAAPTLILHNPHAQSLRS